MKRVLKSQCKMRSEVSMYFFYYSCGHSPSSCSPACDIPTYEGPGGSACTQGMNKAAQVHTGGRMQRASRRQIAASNKCPPVWPTLRALGAVTFTLDCWSAAAAANAGVLSWSAVMRAALGPPLQAGWVGATSGPLSCHQPCKHVLQRMHAGIAGHSKLTHCKNGVLPRSRAT